MLAEIYYETYFGCYPFKTSEAIDTTRKTMQYLKDAGLTNTEIVQLWESIGKKNCVTPDDLPEILWEDSLLQKGTFYYHHSLQLPAMPLVMNEDGTVVTQPFKLEMKIKYTIDDLLEYYYNKTRYHNSLQDRDKDIGAMKYLLKKYSKLEHIEAVDFILGMIDYAAATEDDLAYSDILALNSQYAAEAMRLINYKAIISKQSGYGKIIWR